jgi:F-type H+-transporting ATPase subunit delta
MKTSKQLKREAREFYRTCVVSGLLDESRARQFVQRAIEDKHRGFLALLSEFLRLLRLNRSEHTAEVETATPLPNDLRASVQVRLENRYGPGTTVQFANRPALIGGMRIKVGSDVYDGSVQSELAALEKSF